MKSSASPTPKPATKNEASAMFSLPSSSNSANDGLIGILTPKEIEYVRLFLNPSMTYEAAAVIKSVSVATVATHVQRICSKMGETRIGAAAARYVRNHQELLGEAIRFYLPEGRDTSNL